MENVNLIELNYNEEFDNNMISEKDKVFIKDILKNDFKDSSDVGYYCTERMVSSEYISAKRILFKVFNDNITLEFVSQEEMEYLKIIYKHILKKEQQKEEMKLKEKEAWKQNPERFFEKKKFIPTLLEKEVENENDIIFVNDIGFHIYNGQYWRKVHENVIQHIIKQKLGDKAMTSYIKNVTELIEKEKQIDGDKLNNNRNRIILLNGTLDLSDWKNPIFYDNKFYREDYGTIQLNCNYDKDAKSPTFEKYLETVFENDNERINLIGEMLGYCLVPSTKFEKGFMLYGSGSNGKSVLLDVIKKLITEDNISSVDLSDLEKSFSRSMLYNKLVNLTDEMEGKIKDSGFYKRIASGNTIEAQFKFKDSFNFKPFCTMVFAMNNFPQINDKTHGLYRKMILIPFDVTIKEEDQDKDLGEKLKNELDGILQVALTGLNRLAEQNRFTHSLKGNSIMEEFKRNSNPVEIFFDDMVVENKEGEINSKELYALYTKFCNDEGIKDIMNNINFGKEVKKKFPSSEKKKLTRGGNRENYYLGIELSY